MFVLYCMGCQLYSETFSYGGVLGDAEAPEGSRTGHTQVWWLFWKACSWVDQANSWLRPGQMYYCPSLWNASGIISHPWKRVSPSAHVGFSSWMQQAPPGGGGCRPQGREGIKATVKPFLWVNLTSAPACPDSQCSSTARAFLGSEQHTFQIQLGTHPLFPAKFSGGILCCFFFFSLPSYITSFLRDIRHLLLLPRCEETLSRFSGKTGSVDNPPPEIWAGKLMVLWVEFMLDWTWFFDGIFISTQDTGSLDFLATYIHWDLGVCPVTNVAPVLPFCYAVLHTSFLNLSEAHAFQSIGNQA